MELFGRVMLWMFAFCFAVALCVFAVIFGPSFIQPLYLPKLTYNIPDGYRGWVIFEVGNAHCTPLPREGRSLIFTVDPKGRGCTSDEAPQGWRTVRYKCVRADGSNQNLPDTGWGKGGMIWDEFYRTSGGQKMNVFFIGTEQEFDKAESAPIKY